LLSLLLAYFDEVAMFRVVGRDAQGQVRELSVNVSTAQEAKASALGAGIVTVESVSSLPLLSLPPRTPAASAGRAVGGSCLGGVLGAILGVVVGWGLVHWHQERASTGALRERRHTAPQDLPSAGAEIVGEAVGVVYVGILDLVVRALVAALGGIIGAIGGATVGAAVAGRVRRKRGP
jgi:hypothetical protein